QDMLALLREELDASTILTTPAGEARNREVEHWRVDDQGYLVLSDAPQCRPAVEPAPAHVYQALLDGLNAHSGRRG
ncbi:MAG: hypothetical protein WCF18_03860, partial [Chthoniobacteraceae bacterium]